MSISKIKQDRIAQNTNTYKVLFQISVNSQGLISLIHEAQILNLYSFIAYFN
ncbi:MAG: hypothetical protein PWR20_2410 [Bacteroidales bacterium]|jgi:hypothetical protein|nr:hypothetical protein [Bacteroidales bacterium]